ncbi:hypothetical protein PybrP1_008706 [[Pythium] brassicae (nom. inval.)]|nr:hypothetical protein PybrP1_008706 [[Pythium] brassicae (nom. inval.)]
MQYVPSEGPYNSDGGASSTESADYIVDFNDQSCQRCAAHEQLAMRVVAPFENVQLRSAHVNPSPRTSNARGAGIELDVPPGYRSAVKFPVMQAVELRLHY